MADKYPFSMVHGPLTKYVKLRVAHAPRMPGTFSPPPTSKEIASWQSRHASRHVRHARAVMHVWIANPWVAGKTFPAFPVHAQPSILCIWQEAHVKMVQANSPWHEKPWIVDKPGGPDENKNNLPMAQFSPSSVYMCIPPHQHWWPSTIGRHWSSQSLSLQVPGKVANKLYIWVYIGKNKMIDISQKAVLNAFFFWNKHVALCFKFYWVCCQGFSWQHVSINRSNCLAPCRQQLNWLFMWFCITDYHMEKLCVVSNWNWMFDWTVMKWNYLV